MLRWEENKILRKWRFCSLKNLVKPKLIWPQSYKSTSPFPKTLIGINSLKINIYLVSVCWSSIYRGWFFLSLSIIKKTNFYQSLVFSPFFQPLRQFFSPKTWAFYYICNLYESRSNYTTIYKMMIFLKLFFLKTMLYNFSL